MTRTRIMHGLDKIVRQDEISIARVKLLTRFRYLLALLALPTTGCVAAAARCALVRTPGVSLIGRLSTSGDSLVCLAERLPVPDLPALVAVGRSMFSRPLTKFLSAESLRHRLSIFCRTLSCRGSKALAFRCVRAALIMLFTAASRCIFRVG